MPSPSPTLAITQARSDADVRLACDILIEAADWLTSIGQSLWDRDSLTPANVRPSPTDGTLYLAHLDGQPVGTFRLQFEDPLFWPDVPPGESLYLHKLAVRRSAAGRGLSRRLLDFAVAEARAAGRPYLRLDCVHRPKLRAVYESAGFLFHSDRTVGRYAVRRYQRPTTSSPADG
jgi:GNAT superfamily N-acetyltransferase